MARVLSVNVGVPRPIPHRGGTTPTAIFKTPVDGQVAVAGESLAGDVQADRRVHGGPDQAVYAYAREDYAWWEGELGRDLAPGTFGENLTVEGVEVTLARIGERWRVGTALLEVTAPRIPCFKLAHRMGEPRFVRRFAEAARPGAYFRILEAGDVAAGDAIDVVERPDHDVTIAVVNAALLGDHALAPRLLGAPALPERVLAWARERAA